MGESARQQRCVRRLDRRPGMVITSQPLSPQKPPNSSETARKPMALSWPGNACEGENETDGEPRGRRKEMPSADVVMWARRRPPFRTRQKADVQESRAFRGPADDNQATPEPVWKGTTMIKTSVAIVFTMTALAGVRVTVLPAQQPSDIVAIRAARMIDGTGEAARENMVVIVEGDSIARIGPRDAIEIPAGARIVDLPDHTLMPGLIDAHAHVSVRVDDSGLTGELAGMAQPGAQQMARVPRNLRVQLLSGVTSAYVVGETQNIDIYAKQAVESGLFPGPRIYPGGLWISTTAGLGPPESLVFNGPWDLRRTIREQFEQGAHHIKLMVINRLSLGPNAGRRMEPGSANFTVEELEAAVDEAHRLGLHVTAHASGSAAARALEAGVNSIQHAGDLNEQLLDLFLERDAGFVNTFVIGFGGFFDDEWQFLDTEATGIREWLERCRQVIAEARQMSGARDRSVRSRWRELMMARDRGVMVTVGTDNIQGVLPLEVANLVDAGFTPLEAITAATGGAARVVGIDDDVGTIAIGKFADLIAVAGRPDENIDSLFEPVFIMVGGHDYSGLSFH